MLYTHKPVKGNVHANRTKESAEAQLQASRQHQDPPLAEEARPQPEGFLGEGRSNPIWRFPLRRRAQHPEGSLCPPPPCLRHEVTPPSRPIAPRYIRRGDFVY